MVTTIETILDRLTDARCGVFLDIDETLLNPLNRYHKRICSEMQLSITIPQIEQAGGLDNLFRNHPRYAEFKTIADKLRADLVFNSGLPLIEGALAGANELASIEGVRIAAYLTTRPHLVAEVTEQDLRENGFPNAPVMMRPPSVSRESTVEWKISILREVNARCSALIVMVDDSLALGEAIKEENRHLTKPILAVVFVGPLTYSAVRAKGVVSSPDEAFYVAQWSDVPGLCRHLVSE